MNPINLLSIGIASDHAGFDLKNILVEYLESLGAIVYDFGSHSEKSVDYPDFAHPLASAVEKGSCDYGIAICGTGNGINMTVNHHAGVRGALCWQPEIARLARQHNNANILSLPARFISKYAAIEIVKAFFSTDFEGGRHQDRIDKIKCASAAATEVVL
ncbi:MAG: ribose 5-phosphate isomerase B [Prevotellaceae bacterium]|jgi:ribose 5-phosphate isomerase B|nr:ribose 5-phosphate isomerase B [Prevotellaceae bacterium]